MDDDELSASTGDNGDFEVTSNSVTPEELTARLTPADSPEPPEAEPAAEGRTTPPAASEAGKQLPRGDQKAGKTLSDRARTIQAEINQLTAQKHTTRRETEAARQELYELRLQKDAILAAKAELGQQAAPEKAAAKPAATADGAQPKPKVDQFETYEEYSDALAEWATTESERRTRSAIAEALEQERQQWRVFEAEQQQQGLFAQHQHHIDETRSRHADFDQLIEANADLPTNPMMDTHIMHSDVGGELMHYLAANPEECERIAGLAAGPTLVALGRIEARLEAAKSGPAPKVPAISHARPPIKPVGGGSGSADDMPGEDASLDEHVSYWNRQERSLSRR